MSFLGFWTRRQPVALPRKSESDAAPMRVQGRLQTCRMSSTSAPIPIASSWLHPIQPVEALA